MYDYDAFTKARVSREIADAFVDARISREMAYTSNPSVYRKLAKEHLVKQYRFCPHCKLHRRENKRSETIRTDRYKDHRRTSAIPAANYCSWSAIRASGMNESVPAR